MSIVSGAAGAKGENCDQGQSKGEEASAAGAVTCAVTVPQAGGHIASQESGVSRN